MPSAAARLRNRRRDQGQANRLQQISLGLMDADRWISMANPLR
jgi:hypothetical protein